MNERGRKLGGGEVCIAQCNDCSFVCCPLRDRPAGGFFQMGGIRPSLSARSRGLLTSSVPCIRVIRSLAVGRFVFHYKSQLGDLHSPLRQRPGGPATRPPATALYSPPPAGQAAHGAFRPADDDVWSSGYLHLPDERGEAGADAESRPPRVLRASRRCGAVLSGLGDP